MNDETVSGGTGGPDRPPSSGAPPSGWSPPDWSPPPQPPTPQPPTSPRFAPPVQPPYTHLPPPPPMPPFPQQSSPGWVPAFPGYGPPGYPAQPTPLGAGAIRVDIVEGTQFGLAYPAIQPTPSGPSIGSMVAGIASILVSFLVGCFGLAGSADGWGPAVAGAFAVLAVFVGGGAVGLGVVGLRQIRRGGGTVRGRGMALAGISTGGAGLGFALLLFLMSVLATAGSVAQ